MKEEKFEATTVDDVVLYHGEEVECKLQGTYIVGTISLGGPDAPYLCQNLIAGNCPDDKLGYEFGWSMKTGLRMNGVEDLKKLEARTIEGVKVYHGMRVTCIINSDVITDAKVSFNKDDGAMFICQNMKQGASADDYLDYECSWGIGGDPLINWGVSDFKPYNTGEREDDVWWKDIKKGDEVTCTEEPGIHSDNDELYGGAGYEPGKKFIVDHITTDVSSKGDKYAIFFPKATHGVYHTSIVKPGFELKVSKDIIPYDEATIDTIMTAFNSMLIPPTSVISRTKTFDPIVNLGF